MRVGGASWPVAKGDSRVSLFWQANLFWNAGAAKRAACSDEGPSESLACLRLACGFFRSAAAKTPTQNHVLVSLHAVRATQRPFARAGWCRHREAKPRRPSLPSFRLLAVSGRWDPLGFLGLRPEASRQGCGCFERSSSSDFSIIRSPMPVRMLVDRFGLD